MFRSYPLTFYREDSCCHLCSKDLSIYTNEINSPGRTNNHPSRFWLAESFFIWNHVSAWKKQFLNEVTHLQNDDIYFACNYFVNYKSGEECQKTFTCACRTLLLWVKREKSYIFYLLFLYTKHFYPLIIIKKSMKRCTTVIEWLTHA